MFVRGPITLGLLATCALASAGDTTVSNGGTPPPTTTASSNLAQLKLPAGAKVMVIPIHDTESTRYGMIDPWQAAWVGRRTREAQREGYDLIVLEIDTYGGMVSACEEINRHVADSGVPAIAFVKGKAFSGGAILALGCRAITMEPGSQVGGAQAVDIFGDLQSDQREKARALLVNMVRGLCERNNYPGTLARGMVDREVEIVETSDPAHRFMTRQELDDWIAAQDTRGAPPPVLRTIKKEDEILSLTASEAVTYGLSSGSYANRDAVLAAMGLANAQVSVNHITVTEKVARFLGHPGWCVLLVVVALIALVWELKTPGIGVGLGVFGVSLGLFFWLMIFVDNAGAAELILFGLGLALLVVEIFFTPGFGVAGIGGICAVLCSIVLSFIPEGTLSEIWKPAAEANPFQAERLAEGLQWGMLAFFAFVVAAITALVAGVKLPGISRLALKTAVAGPGDLEALAAPAALPAQAPGKEAAKEAPPEKAGAVPPAALADLVGKIGVAETVLKPSGKIRLDGKTWDANAEGGWIDAGLKVKVLAARSTGLIVREVGS